MKTVARVSGKDYGRKNSRRELFTDAVAAVGTGFLIPTGEGSVASLGIAASAPAPSFSRILFDRNRDVSEQIIQRAKGRPERTANQVLNEANDE